MQKMKKLFQMLVVATVMLSSADAVDWKTRYKAFNEVVPPEGLEQTLTKIFNTKLSNFEIKESSFEGAIDIIRKAYKDIDDTVGLSFVVDSDIIKRKVKLPKRTITLGDALDTICFQSGAVWDFDNKIRIRLNKNN